VIDKLNVQPVKGGPLISLKDYISKDKTLFIFGTCKFIPFVVYFFVFNAPCHLKRIVDAADFNALEYAQRLRYYQPILEKECGITKFGLLLNCEQEAAIAMADLVDLDTTKVDVFVDNTGAVGKEWGVGRGWLADDDSINPFLKLFGMLWGLGAWATLPAVIGGYVGNPFKGQPWIEDALAVGTRKGRFPTNAVELNENGEVVLNKFSELPIVGDWPRRPLELATLRLQSMMGISLKEWKTLAPNEEALGAGVLTQLGGCIVVDGTNGETLFDWKDPGICAVANFEDIVTKLKA
jgi:hypothetical protein